MRTQKYLVRDALSRKLFGIVSNHPQNDKTIASIVNCINDGERCNVIEFNHETKDLLNPFISKTANFRIILDGDVDETKLFVEFMPIYEY